MPRDFLEELAEAPVPPVPVTFNRALHERLNRRLVAGQMLDLALHGMGYTVANFARAMGGLLMLTATGKYDRESKDH